MNVKNDKELFQGGAQRTAKKYLRILELNIKAEFLSMESLNVTREIVVSFIQCKVQE